MIPQIDPMAITEVVKLGDSFVLKNHRGQTIRLKADDLVLSRSQKIKKASVVQPGEILLAYRV